MMMRMAMLAALMGSVGCLAGEPELEPRTASAEPTSTKGAPDTATAEQPLQAPAATTTTDQICRALMQRQRGCTARFIPALVDARVKQDNPPGVAAQERERGREALVKEALAEWEVDASDAKIGMLCDDIAQSISPEKDGQLRSSASACLAAEGCDAFVSCAVPLNLVHWKS